MLTYTVKHEPEIHVSSELDGATRQAGFNYHEKL